jgi:hypothetical protein
VDNVNIPIIWTNSATNLFANHATYHFAINAAYLFAINATYHSTINATYHFAINVAYHSAINAAHHFANSVPHVRAGWTSLGCTHVETHKRSHLHTIRTSLRRTDGAAFYCSYHISHWRTNIIAYSNTSNTTYRCSHNFARRTNHAANNSFYSFDFHADISPHHLANWRSISIQKPCTNT